MAGEIPKELNHYLQKTADYIKVYWEFHKDRLAAGRIPFVLNHNNVLEPFNLDKRVEPFRNGGSVFSRNVVREYNQGVFLSMCNSLDALKYSLYQKFDPAKVSPHQPHEDMPDFYVGAYVYDLFLDISVNSISHSQVTGIHDPTEGRVIEAGLRTGIDMPVQMRAIMGEEFMAKDAVAVSKIDLEYLQPAKTMTGLTSFLSFREPSFSLFHPDTRINAELLKYMGKGKAAGCPASRMASLETRTYLNNNGRQGNVMMLPEFCNLMSTLYGLLVEDWYRKLSDEDKILYVDTKARELLSGEVWSVIKSRGHFE